jgi:AraC-like DNA-binding protein
VTQVLGFSVLFGALLAFLMAMGQLFRAPKNKNIQVFVSLMFTVSIWQGHTGLLVSEIDSTLVELLSFFLVPASLAFLPLFYTYGRRILSPEYHLESQVRFAVFLFCFGIMCEGVGIVFFHKDTLLKFIFIVSGFSRVMTIVLALYLNLLAVRKKEDQRIINFREIRISIFLLTITTFIGTSVSFYAQLLGQLRSNLHAAGALFVSITIVILYFLKERNPAYFNLEHLMIRDRKISVDPEILSELDSAIHKLIQEEAIYRTEELNIAQFTEAVNLEGFKFSQKQISEYINIMFKKNFNVWINDFRIEEACLLLQENKNQSILSIAFAVGFNSKSSFHSIFKRSKRMTPNEFRAKHFT